MKITKCALGLSVASALCLQIALRPAHAQSTSGDSEFPYVIQPELGSSEFVPGDGITIVSLRGNRKHIEPGGRYLLEGTYTLASADNADLAWFGTTRTRSRGTPRGTPIAEDQHVEVTRGTGNFRLVKTVTDDSWLHVSFYVKGHSTGGTYFGEKGFERTVLRKNGSDATLTNPANMAILAYLGNPVAPPADLDAKYAPTNLVAAFNAISEKAGWRVEKLAVDDSEFPFLVYGLLAGHHQLNASDIREVPGYDYAGSVRGSTGGGSTYFALNMIPNGQYPESQATACHRRLMVRLQMLADAAGQGE